MKKNVKSNSGQENGCDGSVMAKVLITGKSILRYPSFTRNQHKILLSLTFCCEIQVAKKYGCDGSVMAKNLIMTIQVNYVASFTRNQHKIHLNCHY